SRASRRRTATKSARRSMRSSSHWRTGPSPSTTRLRRFKTRSTLRRCGTPDSSRDVVDRTLPTATLDKAATAARPIPRARRRPRIRTQAVAGYLFLLPALVLTAAFVLWPIAQSFRLSLYAWNGDGPQTFVGLQNFIRIAQDKSYTA